jgi:hypothetical protein
LLEDIPEVEDVNLQIGLEEWLISHHLMLMDNQSHIV